MTASESHTPGVVYDSAAAGGGIRPTPETDAYIGDGNDDNMTEGEIAMCEYARRLERQRDELRDAIRNMRDTYGRHKTMIATQRLFELLPETKKQ